MFFSGLPAGGLVVVGFYAVALGELTAEQIARMHARFHPLTHRSMQLSTILAGLAALALAIWDDPSWRAYTILLFVGFLGPVIQAVLSRFWVVPASDEMIAWGTAGPPSDKASFMRSWTILHSGRIVGALLAFFCYTLAIVIGPGS